jgi:hypothetical protein
MEIPGKYHIIIIEEQNFYPHSTDNIHQYELRYCKLGENRDTTRLGIQVFINDLLYNSIFSRRFADYFELI